ncbi:MAG: FAD-dependent thymidylate synthase [Actinobacteria bacterium]|nr:FAD-dependent thymidylate synthase [Actinomycetota bacterium]
MHSYVTEEFSDEEAEVLRRYVTNLDGPVFALVNLPEVVKGALFARYSRTHKSLRRLFLDEFVGELDMAGDASIDATVGLQRAEDLYQKVFFEYGDDSVAQLGGVHLACEQASNLLTKVLEWGRLMAYLEQSTRYLAYDTRLGGRYRYHRPPEILSSPLGTRYVADVDALFTTYAEMVPVMQDWFREQHPKQRGDSDLVYRRALRAKAFDSLRGLLPAAALSNVGIYGNGQGYEMLILRMRAHPLPEVRSYAELMLTELRKVIPSFLTRLDRPDRGGAWTEYLATTARATEDVAHRLLAGAVPEPRPSVTLVDWDPEAEDKLLAAILYPHSQLPDDQLLDIARKLPATDRAALLEAWVGDRQNRRHKPGRALERVTYRFDVLSDYGAFRDLQRHRMLTLQWQPLTPDHGYVVPEDIASAGLGDRFQEAMARSHALYEALVERFPAEAGYAVALAFRLRYSIELNARAALHMLELRTQPAGHPSYRRVCQEMHRLIAERAGHPTIAGLMRFVDHAPAGLERLEGERRSEARGEASGGPSAPLAATVEAPPDAAHDG